jgi:phosphate uptake regulator
MKRKINRVGQNTLTVSLPTKWVKKIGLKQGDELELTEEGSNLIIGSSIKPQKFKINIDLSDSGTMLNRVIAAIYKAGFAQASVYYKTPKELDIIQSTVYRSCHVWEIMNVKKNNVEIHSISELNPDRFNQILRKLTYAVSTISKETIEAIENNDYEQLSNIILKDRIVDRHSDYCRRIINRGFELEYKRYGPLYVISEQMEVAADVFKIINKDIIDNKSKLSKDLMKLLKEIDILIDKLNDMIFDFDINKIRVLGMREVKIRKLIDKICAKENKNVKILAYLINLFETIFEMKSAVITLHIDDEKQVN